jgi:hypothetical protein
MPALFTNADFRRGPQPDWYTPFHFPLPLQSGVRLGPYEILAPLGAGGPVSVRGRQAARGDDEGLAVNAR